MRPEDPFVKTRFVLAFVRTKLVTTRQRALNDLVNGQRAQWPKFSILTRR